MLIGTRHTMVQIHNKTGFGVTSLCLNNNPTLDKTMIGNTLSCFNFLLRRRTCINHTAKVIAWHQTERSQQKQPQVKANKNKQ